MKFNEQKMNRASRTSIFKPIQGSFVDLILWCLCLAGTTFKKPLSIPLKLRLFGPPSSIGIRHQAFHFCIDSPTMWMVQVAEWQMSSAKDPEFKSHSPLAKLKVFNGREYTTLGTSSWPNFSRFNDQLSGRFLIHFIFF